MSNFHERNDIDVTARDSYDLDNKEVFSKQMQALNLPIIKEFRANGGKVGGQFAGHTMLLLHTIGAKSHQERVNPLGYIKESDHYIVIASKAGAVTNPDWYHNIIAHPEVWVEVGTEHFKAHATVPEREERDRLFAEFIKQEPGMGEYQQHTTRVLPVVILKRV